MFHRPSMTGQEHWDVIGYLAHCSSWTFLAPDWMSDAPVFEQNIVCLIGQAII